VNIPAVGAAQGIFELFVPGAFLLLNALFVAYSALGPENQAQLREFSSNGVLSFIVLICFGYLIGVIMRLFKTETPDRWSARLLRFTAKDSLKNQQVIPGFGARWDPKTTGDRAAFQLWVIEDFPYVGWLGEVHTFGAGLDEAEAIQEFHRRVWAGPTRSRHQHKTFFNFCKTLINSADERAATEIYVAEALNRYLTGMFYSLLIALGLMAAGLAIQLVSGPGGAGLAVFVLMFLVYAAMLLVIVRQYRVSRIKEVSIVFGATYRHRQLFDSPRPQDPQTWTG
jgi:hypothetical protein